VKAIVLDAGQVRVEERPAPDLVSGEALVEVILAGVCSTDLELAKGYMGFAGVPGHEFVGRIVSAPDQPSRVGQRVVGEINASCRRCETCLGGFERHCPNRTVLGILNRSGAFAQILALPLANLHALPPNLSNDRAVFVEPVAAAYEIATQIPVAAGRTLVLGGGGKLGALIARVLRICGALVSLRGRRPEALAPLVADGFPIEEDSPQPRYDLVVEATGTSDALGEALRWVRPRGIVALKSTTAATSALDLAPVVIDEISIVGSRCGPFAPAIAALAAGLLEPEKTIAARFSLDQAVEAFAVARDPHDPSRRKVVFDIDA